MFAHAVRQMFALASSSSRFFSSSYHELANLSLLLNTNPLREPVRYS